MVDRFLLQILTILKKIPPKVILGLMAGGILFFIWLISPKLLSFFQKLSWSEFILMLSIIMILIIYPQWLKPVDVELDEEDGHIIPKKYLDWWESITAKFQKKGK